MIISRAPVRISMGGGGTDLASYYSRYGGFLMATAINKFVYILLNKRFESSVRLSYSKTEIVDNIENIEHNIFREALKYFGVDRHIELVSMADVPSNCGLGTSSTFTVALLNALFAFKRNYVSLSKLAETACYIEIDILKEPIGKQDQYVAAYGGFNGYYFNQDGTVDIEPISISDGALMELQSNLFLFYLNKNRFASNVLKEQDTKVKENNNEIIERLHKIKEIGLYTKKVFESGKIDEFGELLNEHWKIKKGLSNKISDNSIDEIYDVALKNGALGGKVVGAGGGGFLLFYCPSNKIKFLEAMEQLNLRPTWFNFEKEGAKKIFSD